VRDVAIWRCAREDDRTYRPVLVDCPWEPRRASRTSAGTLDFIFKNTRGNKRKFTPRQLTLAHFENVPLLCMSSPSGPTASALLTTSIPTQIKLAKTPRHPSQAKPKPNSYSYSFSSGFANFTGTFSGRVYKVNGRGKVLAIGKLTIQDLDFSGSGPINCATSGVRDWAASQCRTEAEGGSLPICSERAAP
jgi:hypothetical protein